MTDLPLRRMERPRPSQHRAAPMRPGRRRHALERVLLALLGIITVGGLAWGALLEMRTSYFEALLISRATAGMSYRVEAGPSRRISFPTGGPYDDRLGYSKLSSFIAALSASHFAIDSQARFEDGLAEFVAQGGYAPYREKTNAGLAALDRSGIPLFTSHYPQRLYPSLDAVPALIVNTLLFIENRELLDPDYPMRNPAIAWNRLALAVGGRIAGLFDPALRAGGASTLATQLVKFRHSSGGRTDGVGEKLRQMATASVRAYLDGPDTTAARRDIVVAYLNSTPLSSRPGYGEVIGLADGLAIWYGIETTEANRVLGQPARDGAALAEKARIYKAILSLLLGQRRPSHYLIADHDALSRLTSRYLHLMYTAGIINPALYEAARDMPLRFRDEVPAAAPVSFVERKAADAVRTELLSLLHLSNLYDLDRLDLTAETTLDEQAERQVTDLLRRLGEHDVVKALGLVGKRLLGNADPARINYSVVLYQREPDRNVLRVQADSLNEPFDINSGGKLMLGSTAKLRTLITYLDIMSELYSRYAQAAGAELQAAEASARDPLTRWTVQYLAHTPRRDLRGFLDAAVERRYSANPNESFFTGGGIHDFQNFEHSEDDEVFSVEDGFRHSVNLVFIRLMRDIVTYHIARSGAGLGSPLADLHAQSRQVYLRRFAEQEGRAYLSRFFDDYRELTPQAALARLAGRVRPVPRRLAVLFRSVSPVAASGELSAFLKARLSGLAPDDAAVAQLYAAYGPDRFSLADRGYLAGVHPLELWLVGYLQRHPKATRAEVMQASASERQEVYRWLFKTRSKHKQDIRIRIMLEEEAFGHILDDWRRLGYPFGQLVPSYATAIGSSGDRPDALAELIGIILNDGVRLPAVRVDRVRFAANTPYETEMSFRPPAPERLLSPEVAATARRALLGVVEQGTGQRARGSFSASNGAILPIGGKTGTGDNRYEVFGPGRRLIESRPVDRTATFAFFIGDRFFGTITAYVSGEEAGEYQFTSALAVQLLKVLGPALQPLVGAPPPAGSAALGAAPASRLVGSRGAH